MADCNKARRASVDKLRAAYNPIISELGNMIANMRKRGLDPTKYYDAANDQVINLVELAQDLTSERDDDIKEIKQRVDEECLTDTEEFMQSMVDHAVLFYTNGLSLVLPKHMTHIDVKEILSGKPLGGENSVFNEVREGVFRGMGLGENNDLRKVLKDPVKEAGKVGENVVNEGRRALRKLGIRL